MKVNGKKETDMEKESIFGQMEMSMKAILSKANPKDKVFFPFEHIPNITNP